MEAEKDTTTADESPSGAGLQGESTIREECEHETTHIEPETHEEHEKAPESKDEPATEGKNKAETTREEHKKEPGLDSHGRKNEPVTNEGLLDKARHLRDKIKDTVTGTVKSAATKLGGALSYVVGRKEMVVVYEKKTTIDLPHGKDPKIYWRLIRFRPIDCKPSPVITLTMKPSGRCHHEDTHLFMRVVPVFRRDFPSRGHK